MKMMEVWKWNTMKMIKIILFFTEMLLFFVCVALSRVHGKLDGKLRETHLLIF